MPHISIKIWPGRSQAEKQKIADAIVKDFVEVLGSSYDSLSVAIEDVKQEDWAETVVKPEIVAKSDLLFKKPGYKV